MDQAAENNVAFMMFAGIIGMLLLAVAVILFFVVYQRRLLQQQDKMLQMKLAHQRESLESIIEAQEAERKRIAQELHDGIGALLSATKMYVNRLPPGETVSNDIGFIRQETTGLIDETIDNIRTITRNLLPTSLERFGLMAAVEDLCKRINDLGVLTIEFFYSQDKRFDIQKEFALYRILQELTNNTLKYAEASKVQITLNIVDQQLKMTYRDDGKGFDLSQWEGDQRLQKGLGIRGIKSRVDVLDATIQMQSNENQGFFLSLELDM